MFVSISNTPRDYAWGSTTAIADFLGTEPTGRPQAELWLGAHPGSPSRLSPVTWQLKGARTLDEWISADPQLALGLAPDAAEPPRLPYLLKLLAADAPLSLQAHPTTQQAEAGFARENAAGIPIDAPHRNYRDPYAKPELVVALSDRFDALCGFRDVTATRGILTALVDAAEHHGLAVERLAALRDGLTGADALASTVRAVLTERDGDLIAETVAACGAALALMGGADAPADAADDEPRAAMETVVDAAERYPSDPGVVLSLLLNRVTLRPGEALWLPAGNIHAYLSGLGMELMEASDNVLRGGLTSKHIDVPELMAVLSFHDGPPPRLEPTSPGPGVRVYRPDAGFELVRARVDDGEPARVSLGGSSIVVAESGSVHITGQADHANLARGLSAFVTAEERQLEIVGRGSVFVATPQRG